MYEDYVKAKEVDIPDFMKEEQTNRTTTIYYIKRGSKRNPTIIRKEKRPNFKKQFDDLNESGKKINTGLSDTTKTIGLVLGGILIATAAVVSCKKFLSSDAGVKLTTAIKESQYKPTGLASGSLSPTGEAFIKKRESLRLTAYKSHSNDPWTIGWGHTGKVDGKAIHAGMTITKEKADELFRNDISRFEKAVRDNIKVPITQNQFDALVSFCYNAGQYAFIKSVAPLVNAGKFKDAANKMSEYNKIQDKNKKYIVSQGLVNRRKEETAMFLSDVDTSGKIKSKTPTLSVSKAHIPDSIISDKQNYQGGKVNGISVMGNVTITAQQKEYLKALNEQNFSGVVTSGYRPGTSGHGKGYKMDFGFGGLLGLTGKSTLTDEAAEQFAQFVIPLIKAKDKRTGKHLTVHICFEAICGRAKNARDDILTHNATIKICSQLKKHSEIEGMWYQWSPTNTLCNERGEEGRAIQQDKVCIGSFGNRYASGPHIDVKFRSDLVNGEDVNVSKDNKPKSGSTVPTQNNKSNTTQNNQNKQNAQNNEQKSTNQSNNKSFNFWVPTQTNIGGNKTNTSSINPNNNKFVNPMFNSKSKN